MAIGVLNVFLFVATIYAVSAEWRLRWSDDFDGAAGSGPNADKWNREIGGSGWGNQEKQFYTSSTSNAALDGNGFLNIIARNDDAAQHQCWYGKCQYTSARLTTKGKLEQTYGRFEARIKLLKGKGLWPAFWMLGANIDSVTWPHCGEIDIMEFRGSKPETSNGAIHGPGFFGGDAIVGSFHLPAGSFSDDFHVYAVEWFPDRVTWFVDGKEFTTLKSADLTGGRSWVFDKPFFLLLNLAIGGHYDGEPEGSYSFPQQISVDYVRVYEWV